MITEEVIQELFKNYRKPPKDKSELQLEHFADLLQPFHSLRIGDKEVFVDSMSEDSPFHRFLIRSINAVLDFDRNVAFVFPNHILFFSKVSDDLNVTFRPQDEDSLLGRIFGRKRR